MSELTPLPTVDPNDDFEPLPFEDGPENDTDEEPTDA